MKVISQADFGVFVELAPGIEALLHKSNFAEGKNPELNEKLDVEIINIDTEKKRMGVKTISITNNDSEATAESSTTQTEGEKQEDKPNEDAKELEHV